MQPANRRSLTLPPIRFRRAGGFTLLEVLVAILILSFGLLGAAGMQVAALQANKEARYQGSAARLARQLTDLMRANVAIASTNVAPTSTTGNPFLMDTSTDTVVFAPACMTSAVNCSALDSAQWAARGWKSQLSDTVNGLPGARAVVCRDTTPFDSSGTPKWDCTAPTAANPNPPMYVKIGWAAAQIGAATASASGAPAMDLASQPKLVVPVFP